jgi:hypothetical protein
MSPSELHHQRAIFEWQSIGVVESDLEGIVRYANGHAMELLGVSDYEGARPGIFFADQTVLSDQLSSRRAGQIGSYRTIVKRASDDALIPVPVTGIPMTNERGQIVGSVRRAAPAVARGDQSPAPGGRRSQLGAVPRDAGAAEGDSPSTW